MPELPDRPNLDQLRHRARDLFREAEKGNPNAMGRIRAVSDRATLSAAQLAIAREYGFASWSKLKTEVERRQSTLSAATTSVSIPPESATIMTNQARRIILLAREESQLLNHTFIGTEHLLLGLASDNAGVSAQALAERGLTLETIRQQVREIIGILGTGRTEESPPFTPRAKTVLELSLREALDLGHQHIAPEHILLGLVAEGEGVATQILIRSGIDLDDLCRAVEERSGAKPRVPRIGGRTGATARPSGPFQGLPASVPRVPQLAACSFCGRRPPVSGRLIQGRAVSICEHCILEWAERLASEEEPENEGDQPTAT
jgi:Clp amino terminal domain, pathogenicity island component/ClpX C4-type zinc finger